MSKNLKKFLKSELAKIDARINVLEANLSRLVLAAVEAVSPQFLEEEEKIEKSKRKKDKVKAKTKVVAAKKEVETKSEEANSPELATTNTEEKKPRVRRSKEEIAAAKTAKTKEETPVVVEKKPRQRRSKEEVEAEKAASELSADDLRHLEGIGVVYAEKLKTQGINNIQDMSELSDARIEEIETVIKGFKKRMETQNWRAQATDLLKK